MGKLEVAICDLSFWCDDYLFFKGNKTNGKDWYLSNVKVVWEDNLPKMKW